MIATLAGNIILDFALQRPPADPIIRTLAFMPLRGAVRIPNFQRNSIHASPEEFFGSRIFCLAVNVNLGCAKLLADNSDSIISTVSEYLSKKLVSMIPMLRAYALILTKSDSHADDLVQDTLERAWRNREMLLGDASFKGWLFNILRNRFIDEIRKDRRLVEDINGESASKLVTLPDQHWSLQYNDLLRAINELRPGLREALFLVMAGGLNHDEAAKVLGCPLGTLKSHIRRARPQLLKFVEIEPRQFPMASKDRLFVSSAEEVVDGVSNAKVRHRRTPVL